ncbi:hypothetical protein [Dysgonomonas capnocytophagoides]|uniref:hypothetical protein n=1 Tax=Dysgonomonas capnocytophagoides TaxID=45254 RepID=UPI0033409141
MGKKGTIVTYKPAISNAFTFLSRELKKVKICNNTKPIDDALIDLNSRKDNYGFWGYNLQKLVFNNIETPRGTMPNNVKSLQIVLSVEIHERGLNGTDCFNPIIIDKTKGAQKNYNFSMEIFGYSDQNKVLSHWHLDFDSSSNNEYIHPDFHLTFGGNAMKSDGDDENQVFGKVLLIPSPRLPHPPMDAILGIDFIIKNFVKKDIANAITCNPQYRKLIRQSQERLWRPYMLSITKHWCNLSCSVYNTDSSLTKKYNPFLED